MDTPIYLYLIGDKILYSKLMSFLIFLLFHQLSIGFYCKDKINNNREIDKLVLLSKAYGYIKYFHPSDEASTVDWNKFLIYSIEEVLNSNTNQDLVETLNHLFTCIAPTSSVLFANQDSLHLTNLKFINKVGVQDVAWQHFGVWLSEKSTTYKSGRVSKNAEYIYNPYRTEVNYDTSIVNLKYKLIKSFPLPGETIAKNIGLDVICTIPLTIKYKSDEDSISINSPGYQKLIKKLDSIQFNRSAENLLVRLADVIIAWNVFQHFYPYFEEIKVDWGVVLRETLIDAWDDKTSDDFYYTLSKMIAHLQDGHGFVYYDLNKPLGGLPIKVDWIENNVVITGSENNIFHKGDIINRIDGVSAKKIIEDDEKYISGSPQLRRYRALNRFGQGELRSIANIELFREDSLINIEFERGKEERDFFFNPITEFDFEGMKEIDDQVYFVNLHKIKKEEFYNCIDRLANAKGVIYDLRWPGERTPEQDRFLIHNTITHLTKTKLKSARWNIPQIIYPDRKDIIFEEERSTFSPTKPFFNTKVVFITDASVISYGETVMGTVEAYNLGEIVGERTGGCNGNVNFIPLIGGYEIRWTGMKVLKHDGTQHHIIGIEPDYPVEKTIKAVKESRDEYLEKAIEIIKAKKK